MRDLLQLRLFPNFRGLDRNLLYFNPFLSVFLLQLSEIKQSELKRIQD